jgi:hypothetical protein
MSTKKEKTPKTTVLRRKEFDAVYKRSELQITHDLDALLHDPFKDSAPAIPKIISKKPLDGYLSLSDPSNLDLAPRRRYVPSIVVAMDPLQAYRSGDYESALKEEIRFFKKCYADAESVSSKLWFAEEAHLSCRSLTTCLNWERFDRLGTVFNVVKSVCESSLDKLERSDEVVETAESIASEVKKGWKRISAGTEEAISKKYKDACDEDSLVRRDRDEFYRLAFRSTDRTVDFTPSFLLPFKVSPSFEEVLQPDRHRRSDSSSHRFDYGRMTLYQLRRFNLVVSFRLNQDFFTKWQHGNHSGELPELFNVMLVVGSERRDSARIAPGPPIPRLDPSFVHVSLASDDRVRRWESERSRPKKKSPDVASVALLSFDDRDDGDDGRRKKSKKRKNPKTKTPHKKMRTTK